jgi:hypothetical protein
MGNYLKHKMQMEKDDLKDCEMLLGYAEEAQAHGEADCATFFYNRAKKRWEDYKASEAEVSKEVDKMRGTASIQGMLYNLLMEDQKERAMKLKHRIENFA